MPPHITRLNRALLPCLSLVILLLVTACGAPGPAQTSTSASMASTGAPTLGQAPSSSHTDADPVAPPRPLQPGDVRFEHLSLDQGLSQSVVTSIVQDSQGFLWFGTQDGLNRYDGYQFKVFKHDPQDPAALSSSFVQALLEGPPGVLWVGTNGGGLDRLDLDTGQFTHFQHDPADPRSLSSNFILSLHLDPDGILWVGTEGGGLNRLNADTNQFDHFRHDAEDPYSLSHDSIVTMFQDRQGMLWLGTYGGGLNRFERDSGRFTRYQHDPADPHSLSDDVIQAILEDREGQFWVATNDGGLNLLDRSSGQFTHVRHDPDDPYSLSSDQAWEIYEDRTGELWIGTFGGGLDRFDRATGQFVHYQNDPNDPYSLNNDQVLHLYQDRAGALWIGTFGGGVSRFDRDQQKFRHYQAKPNDPSSLSTGMVWSILEDNQGVLWIGTNGGGLNRLDPEGASSPDGARFLHYTHEPADQHSLGNDMVWSLLEDSEGVLWVGTHTGLDRLDRDTGQFAHYPAPPVFTILQDREGTIWIGTWAGGIGRLDAETGRFTYFKYDPANPNSLSDDSPLVIHEDQEGLFWIGTFDGGLNSFDPKREQFVRYQNELADPLTLSSNTVLAIHEDSQGILWLGTGGGGLNRFDPVAGTFRSYTEKDGLPNDTVYGILEDDVPPEEEGPNLWLSTNRGLSQFNPQTGVVRNYDVGDGLQSNEFNQGAYHKSHSGQMFFGGVNGFNAFYPEQVSDNPYLPPVVLTALSQGGEAVEVGTTAEALDAISFEWPRNFFEFEFAALNYAQPDKNQYAYKLDGFDPDWIETGNRRFGRYTNLPGGTYTLRVKGSNNDGMWNEEGTSLAVTIVPPFWQTWWFRGSVVLLLVGAAIGAYGLRIRSIEKRSRELEAQVANRTQELATLNAVADVVSRSLDLQEILNDALIKTMEVTGMEAGGVYLLDEHAALLTLAAHQGFPPDFVDEIDRLRLGEGFSGRVAQSGQPLVVRDISVDERLSRTAVQEEGFHTFASIPLDAKGSVIGTLFVVSRGYREFTDQDVQLLTSIGHQIGVALENARLYEDASHRLAHLTALQETTRALASTLDLDRLLDLIIQQATSLVQADAGIINLVDWENKEDEVVAASGLASSLLGVRSSLEASLSGWVTLHNQPMISNQVTIDNRVQPTALPWLTAGRIQSAAFIPLTIKEQVVGTLVVLGQEEGKREFGQPDLDLLLSFADQAATAINNAKLFKTEQRRADELEALRTTMGDITAELELSALLKVIVERAASLLDATGGELGLYDEADQDLRIVVSHNLGQDYVGTLHKLGEGAMGRVAETRQPLIIDDYQTWQGALSQYPLVRATLAAPLKVGDRLVGAFTTITTDPDRRFTPTDLHLLTLFAQQATIAIENARLYKKAQQLAVLEERQRLARDLHDSVTQALYGMALYSEAASEELSLNHVDLVTEYLGELEETAREALGEMRLLIHELRPPLLAQEGLLAALQDRLQAVEGRAGLTARFTADVEGRLPPEIEEGLYRIAREALNNVLKHAQATNVIVELRHQPEDGLVTLAVNDDGVGFDLASARTQGGVGLSAMEERVAVLGGKLVIDSEPGGGTRVFVEVST